MATTQSEPLAEKDKAEGEEDENRGKDVFEIIGGDIYNQELLKRAEIEAASPSGGMLDIGKAKALWTCMEAETSSPALLEVNLKTMCYIVQLYRMDIMAKTFLLENVKLARKMARQRAKLEAQADAAPPSTPQKVRTSKVDALHEIERIEQDIAQAKSITQMRRAQKGLQKWKEAADPDTPPKPKKLEPCRIKLIDGMKHDADILDKAESDMVKNGEITLRTTKCLWRRAYTGDVLLPIQRRSLEYIAEGFDLTETAYDFLDEKLRAHPKISRRIARTKSAKASSENMLSAFPGVAESIVSSRRRIRFKRPSLDVSELHGAVTSYKRYRLSCKAPAPEWAKAQRLQVVGKVL